MSEDEREHLKILIKYCQRRLRLLEERQAITGINTPPEIIIEIEDITKAIEDLHLRMEGQSSQPAMPLLEEQVKAYRPPEFAEYLLHFLPKKIREAVIGDLEEEYSMICARFGQKRADRWYWWQVLASFCPPLRGKSKSPIKPDEVKSPIKLDEVKSPIKLDDLALIGEAGADIVAHLRACLYYAERANEFAQLQKLLRNQLYRMFCPSSDDLAAFQQGLLNDGRRSDVAKHVAACSHCAKELQLLAQTMSDSLIRRPPPFYCLKRVVTELVTPTTRLDELYGTLRGLVHSGEFAYQAQDVQLTIAVQRVANSPDRRVVLGALALEDDLLDTLSYATASLLRNDTLISTVELDDLGNFVLDDLSPGTYSLSLRLPDREVVVESLNL